ncbi:hypothetical protein [Streptosporangium sp. NPDC000509]|uniref:hypothetical protein n=1 Tax=Streptosporangium sp. NPDC000509 TaxID=3366186 RepID=UPI0036C05630
MTGGVGLAEGFGVSLGEVVGFRVGLGVPLGADLVAVAVAVGFAVDVAVAVAVGVGDGAGWVVVPEGDGVVAGGGVPVDVGEEVVLGDGAGVAGAEVAVDVADGAGVAVGFGGAEVGFLASGDGSVVGLVFSGGAEGTFLALTGASVGLVFLLVVGLVVGSDLFGELSVDLVLTGGSSAGRDLLDGELVGAAFLDRVASRVVVPSGDVERRSTGASSSTRGAVFLSPERLRDVGGGLSVSVNVSGDEVSSEGARRVRVSAGGLSSLEREPLSEGGFLSDVERESSEGAERESPDGGVLSCREESSTSEGGSWRAGGEPANSCDGEPELRPGSAMAAHGWAMTALVVADTAASRRPESKVTRRDELRGGIDRSSSIYGVGSGPEMGFQPAAVNSGVPGRATGGTEVARGSGTLTQSPWFAPRMPGCQTMSRLMAYGLE